MSSELKKHYLVIWPTTRLDWINMFLMLKKDIDFTFIPGIFPQEPNFASGFKCRYWSEFESNEQLLNEIRPDGLIFMSIESGLSMTLNFSAKEQGLTTFILQHGIYTNYKDYRNREKLWRKKNRADLARKRHSELGFNALKFILNSLVGWTRLWIFPIALYTKLQQKIGPYWVSKHLPLKIKKASFYLCYSRFNAKIHIETDRVKESEIHYIGSPELSKYLKKETHLLTEPFYLHLDQALAENSFGEETLTKEMMIRFYLKLNDYCLSKNAKLYIKLHPESYATDWLPIHENICFLRQIDNLNWYIQGAIGCFGFYSTMIIPALYWKPTVLFHIQYSELQNELRRLTNVPILQFHSFEINDIIFVDNCVRRVIKNTFIKGESGTSIEKLKKILLNA